MKCTLLKEVFEDRLQLSSRFVSSRVSAVQSIQGAKIEAGEDGLLLTTTNLGDSFHTKMSAEVDVPGTVVFDIKKALEFINFLEAGPLELSLEENQLRIKQGKNQGFFSLYEADDFPELPTLDGKTFPLDQSLLDKIPYVYFSASKDETRPVMTGIYVTNSEAVSYTHLDVYKRQDRRGLEPLTPALPARCSSQLSYRPTLMRYLREIRILYTIPHEDNHFLWRPFV